MGSPWVCQARHFDEVEDLLEILLRKDPREDPFEGLELKEVPKVG